MAMYKEYSDKKYIEKEDSYCDNYSGNNNGEYDLIKEIWSRWKWLTDGWKYMSYEQKCELFFPIVHHINVKDVLPEEFDDYIAKEITEFALKKCRMVRSIQYDYSRDGIPTYSVIYEPININSVPDGYIRASMSAFEKMNGFIKDSIVNIKCN